MSDQEQYTEEEGQEEYVEEEEEDEAVNSEGAEIVEDQDEDDTPEYEGQQYVEEYIEEYVVPSEEVTYEDELDDANPDGEYEGEGEDEDYDEAEEIDETEEEGGVYQTEEETATAEVHGIMEQSLHGTGTTTTDEEAYEEEIPGILAEVDDGVLVEDEDEVDDEDDMDDDMDDEEDEPLDEGAEFSGPHVAVLEVAEEIDEDVVETRQASDQAGTVSITLHSSKEHFDDKAEVIVELQNPELVVEKMIDKLATKFSPETVVTISPGGHPIRQDISRGVGQQVTSAFPVLSSQSGRMNTSISSAAPQQQQVTSQIHGAVSRASATMGPGDLHFVSVSQSNLQQQMPSMPMPVTMPKYQNQSSITQQQQHQQIIAQQTQQSQQRHEVGQRLVSTTNMGENILSQRVISSTILHEEMEGVFPPPDEVKYVEVPMIEEVIRHVTKKEIVEVEKRVPKYEYDWIEKVVEVPQIQYIDKMVEVPRIEEVVRTVSRKEIVEVPREVIKHVTVIEERIVEKIVEVPGPITEIPKPYRVEKQIPVPTYMDAEIPTVVSQSLQPVLRETGEMFNVDACRYEPRVVPVDVYVPLPVHLPIGAGSKVSETHRVVDVPPAHFNSLVKKVNEGSAFEESVFPFVRGMDGSTPLLPINERIEIIPPQSLEWQSGYIKGKIYANLAGGFRAPEAAASMIATHMQSSGSSLQAASTSISSGMEAVRQSMSVPLATSGSGTFTTSFPTNGAPQQTFTTSGDGTNAFTTQYNTAASSPYTYGSGTTGALYNTTSSTNTPVMHSSTTTSVPVTSSVTRPGYSTTIQEKVTTQYGTSGIGPSSYNGAVAPSLTTTSAVMPSRTYASSGITQATSTSGYSTTVPYNYSTSHATTAAPGVGGRIPSYGKISSTLSGR